MHVYYAVTLRNNCSFGHRDQIPRVYPGSNSNTMVMKYIAEKKNNFHGCLRGQAMSRIS